MVTKVDVQQFFLFAMASSGYAIGEKGEPVPDMPGYKEITYQVDRLGDFRLLDRWCVNEGSGRSSGTTTVWWMSQPVFWMSYYGFYREEAIPCLRAALFAAYSRRMFVGGRGPEVYTAFS